MLALSVIALIGSAALARAPEPFEVKPTAQTDAVASKGDAADDPAVWVNPRDPAKSLVITTDKKAGLNVYGLDGKLIQSLPGGRPNNVDVRTGFATPGYFGGTVALVVASDRDGDVLRFWRVDEDALRLVPLPGTISPGVGEVYGVCLYRDPTDGRLYSFVSGKAGRVAQHRLGITPAGTVQGVFARAFEVGGQVEGLAADDANGVLFVAEEGAALWKYPAGPREEVVREAIDLPAPRGHFTPDAEGVAIVPRGDGSGFVILSSQGSSTFIVYDRRPPHRHLGTFRVGTGDGIDAVEETDGIEAVGVNLGPAFPKGVFIAQDGKRPEDERQNFKFVPWDAIEARLSPASR
ncbi:MAG: phytase [Phycisphaeraceae bacterium]|nr:MAG: phytase [Phycisphaeraceae bacterium]